jgi:glutamyl-tRNA synthetase
MNLGQRPVGRLAPSPTGYLHLGHARSFLLAYWQIRAQGGRLLLRLEDLDSSRLKPRFIDATLRDLEWLGIDWDGRPERQSETIDRILAAAAELEQRGLAYACVCTRSELRSVVNAPQAADQEPRYNGNCDGRFASLRAAEALTLRAAGLRFRVPAGPITLHDGFAGSQELDVRTEVGDFMILRRDKVPAYQLAVVVDDAAQGVTDVLRGDDLLPSAARQWHLQRALGLRAPRWFHVPLVCDEQGRRLAKRADDLSLTELRDGGCDPRAIVAWAARSAGIEAPDRISPSEITPSFDLRHLPRGPVVLSRKDVSALKNAR